MAISILNKLSLPGVSINEDNYEKIAMGAVLIASKMNEIYPPKICHLMAKCKKMVTKEEIIALEGSLLAALDFDVAVDHTIYTQMARILGCIYA